MEDKRDKKMILVVDDDVKHLLTAKDLLESMGYEVRIHQFAFGVSNVVREQRPDLVLLDMNMPGLSGEKLSQLLLANSKTRDIPVVFYSSNDEDSLRRAVLEHGVKGYIAKGDVFDLRKKVARYLEA
jgi:CheY-like chemotaxis protein